MNEKDREPSDSRRRLLKGMSLFPAVVLSTGALTASLKAEADATTTPYAPSFFNTNEWTFIHAACDRLIPKDDIGPGAVELGVPEFMDRHMQTPYAAGDIWYMQGPFVEASDKFGYQGRLSLRDILRAGIKASDDYARRSFGGRNFAQLDMADQEKLLSGLEKGAIALEGISSKMFFDMFLGEVRNGYFADPKHGGNKNMGSWKMIGYPGMRADYTDWVEVRDKPYPLPPVDLSGKRG